jgi:hypothetical protein
LSIILTYVLRVHVQNSKETPLEGAYVWLVTSFPATETIPWAATDSSGDALITVSSDELPIQMWGVQLAGYLTQGAIGSPPLTVTMQTKHTVSARLVLGMFTAVAGALAAGVAVGYVLRRR